MAFLDCDQQMHISCLVFPQLLQDLIVVVLRSSARKQRQSCAVVRPVWHSRCDVGEQTKQCRFRYSGLFSVNPMGFYCFLIRFCTCRRAAARLVRLRLLRWHVCFHDRVWRCDWRWWWWWWWCNWSHGLVHCCHFRHLSLWCRSRQARSVRIVQINVHRSSRACGTAICAAVPHRYGHPS